jgi:hypothetical protein
MDREYTLTRLNSFLDRIIRAENKVPFASLYESASAIAYVALTVIKYAPSIPKSVFRQKHVQDEVDCFAVRVAEINDILHPKGKSTHMANEDLRDSKTSITKHMRSFYRDIENNISLFTSEASYISMLMVAR